MTKVFKKVRFKINSFLSNDKEYLILAAISAGLYPLLYYYNSNFTLVNSWSQLVFFIITFLLIPIGIFYLIDLIFNKIEALNKYAKYVLPILNFTTFIFLVVLSIYGFRKKILAVALVVAFLLAILFYKHLKKVILFQLLMTILVTVMLVPILYKYVTYSSEWMNLPDHIESVEFKKKPNIYVIQPDGYANFSELKKSNYNFNNSNFEQFLTDNKFKLYNDFRSNYITTLSSNSSMFAMKHHYYNFDKNKPNELFHARKVIIGDNPVISIFKNNNYKTFLLLEKAYLLVNRSKIQYDYCNIDISEVPYLERGFSINKDISINLEQAINVNKQTNNFFFIEKILPGHVTTYKQSSKGKDKEREGYINKLEEANDWLKNIIQLINRNDKEGIIIIVADHGGFVGMDYTMQFEQKQSDEALVKSIFTAALAIKWPEKMPPQFDYKLKTNVNLFRVLFSYLSNDATYLEFLEEDKSFTTIKDGAPSGIYEVIDENGHVVFNKIED